MPSQAGEEHDTPEHRDDCVTFVLRRAKQMAEQGDLGPLDAPIMNWVMVGACDHEVAAAVRVKAALRAYIELGGMPVTFIRELIADRRAASLE